MITFIIWPKEIDQQFRFTYEAVVDEGIEAKPRQNDTHFIVGSGRITKEHQSQLSMLLDGIRFLQDIPKDEFPPPIEINE